jgi:C-terminal processing protease CtpA/Prc
VGAIALLLAATLAAGNSRAAEAVEREDDARPAVPSVPATPAVPSPPRPPVASSAAPAPSSSGEIQWDRNSGRRTRAESPESRTEVEAKLREAQAKLQEAAAQVAALAAERAAEAVQELPWLNQGFSRHALIGVQLSGESSKDGVKVLDVSPGGPAELAGVRAGDMIVMVDGKDVKGKTSRDVVNQLRSFEPDRKVKLRVMREGKTKDFDVIARPVSDAFVVHGDVPPGFDVDALRGFEPPPPISGPFSSRSELAGLDVTTLTPQLGHYFGTEKGVLVVRAPKNDAFKLQDGDVILAIDGREPTSGSHITRILSSYQPGESLTLKIMRDRKTQDMVVTRPDNRQTRTRTTWLRKPL